MRLPPHCDQRVDPGRGTGGHIRRTEIAVVRQQSFNIAQCAGQHCELVQHRLQLMLVVGGLHHLGGDDQQAAGGDDRLAVVALFEPAARHRHDA